MQLVRTEICPLYSEERQTKEVTFQEHRFICCHVLTNLDHIIIKDLSISKEECPDGATIVSILLLLCWRFRCRVKSPAWSLTTKKTRFDTDSARHLQSLLWLRRTFLCCWPCYVASCVKCWACSPCKGAEVFHPNTLPSFSMTFSSGFCILFSHTFPARDVLL